MRLPVYSLGILASTNELLPLPIHVSQSGPAPPDVRGRRRVPVPDGASAAPDRRWCAAHPPASTPYARGDPTATARIGLPAVSGVELPSAIPASAVAASRRSSAATADRCYRTGDKERSPVGNSLADTARRKEAACLAPSRPRETREPRCIRYKTDSHTLARMPKQGSWTGSFPCHLDQSGQKERRCASHRPP